MLIDTNGGNSLVSVSLLHTKTQHRNQVIDKVLKEAFTVKEYIEHQKRWTLYESLRRCYGDGEEFEKEWTYCCSHIPQGPNNHNFEWYKKRKEGIILCQK